MTRRAPTAGPIALAQRADWLARSPSQWSLVAEVAARWHIGHKRESSPLRPIDVGISMNITDFKDLMSLLADRSSAWQQLWNLLYTVAGAIVALVASGKVPPQYRRLVSVLTTIGFLVFATGNYRALETMRVQREAVVAFVKAQSGGNPQLLALAEASAPPTENELRLYHWGLSLFVSGLLFALPAFQRKAADA